MQNCGSTLRWPLQCTRKWKTTDLDPIFQQFLYVKRQRKSDQETKWLQSSIFSRRRNRNCRCYGNNNASIRPILKLEKVGNPSLFHKKNSFIILNHFYDFKKLYHAKKICYEFSHLEQFWHDRILKLKSWKWFKILK